jgi:PAS domain S-box-containing protein
MTSPGPGEERPSSTSRPALDAALLASLVDQAYDAVFVRTVEGVILYWNTGAERNYGFVEAHAVGQLSHALLQTRFPGPRVTIEELLRQHGRWEGRLVQTASDGRLVTVDARWVLSHTGGEDVVLEIHHDVTERLAAQDAARLRELQLRFVTDSAPVLIAHCDVDHRFKFVNRPYSARFGLHPSQVVGKQIAEVIGPEAYQAIKPYIDRALAGERVDVEVEVPYARLGPQFMRFAYEPEFDARRRVVGYVAAIINVTDRHAAEEALREADRRKDAFLATLSHELRNPLAAMRNAVQLMTVAHQAPATLERAGGIIDRQLKQLVRLVDDLFDVSRITRGQLQLRPVRVQLSDIIRTAVESTAMVIASASQTLTVTLPSEPVHLDADPERLAQAFTNLLMNATKYTPAGGRITLAGEATATEVTVRITDTGAGIPQQDLENVFGMFTQLDATRHQASGGLGIGLTLVRSMVQLHGGSVTAESPGPNRGSTFTVRVPRSQQRSIRMDSDKRPVPATSIVLKRVLIADDNVDAAESLRMWLEMSGHEVHTAHDGPSALAAAESAQPEVVLLDLAMPGMSGFDVARRIRSAPWGSKMVLIALTGWGQDEDRQHAAEAGFNHHLTKPVLPDDVEALIRGV